MSSSSDIEKLFEQFGGDANAYQEIGRENDARAARTRWPLLVTLELTQPAIPAIGQLRDPKQQPPASVAPRPVAVHEDTTPKDMASVTRAKAPLFTRPHRRDIPPVPATSAQPAAPSGASRFSTPDEPDEAAARAAAGVASSGIAAAPGAPAAAPPAPIAPIAPIPPISAPALAASQASVPPTAPAWVAPSVSVSAAPAAPMQPLQATQPTYAVPPAQPAQPPSILGKMFAAQNPSAPPQAAVPAPQTTSLNSLFDRLRGTPGQGAQPSGGPARGGFPSWLTNGSRRP
ncbi:cellulose biosynthesis protein BcsP [Paraburkholderia sp. BR10954]|uniref:cellulose biosynthesis protein BcsP n=1 Tax=Paraburkholderia sp. BR10954 TaxID=3236995 RepID=UPI0034D33A5A